MSNIIPFNDTARLPAHLQARQREANNDLTDNVGLGGYPVVSIKGKVFSLVKGDEREVISRPDEYGEMQPVRSLEIVILKANPKLSKVWYLNGYTEGSAEKPDCFSSDSVAPDPSSEMPQSKTCASCKHNVFGSASNGKGKACSDSRRLAIAAPDQLNEPMLLRVPPASLKPLADYARMLDKRGTDYDAVITRISFDAEEATPRLVLKPLAWLDEAAYSQVQEMKSDDMVDYIITGKGMSESTAPADDGDEEEFEIAGTPPAAAVKAREPEPEKQPDPKPEKPARAPRKSSTKAATPPPAEESENPAPPEAQAAPVTKAEPADDATKAVVTGADNLDDMLAGLGFD